MEAPPADATNTAQVSASDQFDPDSAPGNDDGDQSEDDEVAFTVDPFVADVSLVKLGPATAPNVGDTVTYQIRVSNDGPDAATSIVVRDVPASINPGLKDMEILLGMSVLKRIELTQRGDTLILRPYE